MKTTSENGVSKEIRILQIIVEIIAIGLSITISHFYKQLLPSSKRITLKFLYCSTLIVALSNFFMFASTTIIILAHAQMLLIQKK